MSMGRKPVMIGALALVMALSPVSAGLASQHAQYNMSQQLISMDLEQLFSDTKVRALAQAAGQGKIKQLKQLVSEGVDVNSAGFDKALKADSSSARWLEKVADGIHTSL